MGEKIAFNFRFTHVSESKASSNGHESFTDLCLKVILKVNKNIQIYGFTRITLEDRSL